MAKKSNSVPTTRNNSFPWINFTALLLRITLKKVYKEFIWLGKGGGRGWKKIWEKPWGWSNFFHANIFFNPPHLSKVKEEFHEFVCRKNTKDIQIEILSRDVRVFFHRSTLFTPFTFEVSFYSILGEKKPYFFTVYS